MFKLLLKNVCIFKCFQPDHISQCQKLVHDAYVEKKYITPTPSGYWSTQYPKITLAAKIGNSSVIVGTISVIFDSPKGLPLDKTYKKERPSNLAEIGSLAVKNEYRGSSLFKLMVVEVVSELLSLKNIDHIAIQVNPRHSRFYVKYLPFKYLSDQVVTSEDTQGAPAHLLIISRKDLKWGDKRVLRFKTMMLLWRIYRPVMAILQILSIGRKSERTAAYQTRQCFRKFG